MGHHNHHKAHRTLQARLDQHPSGFPDTPEGMRILRLLFSEEEAEVVARMPFRPTSAGRIAARLGRPTAPVRRLLDQMADKGLIFDIYHQKRERHYYAIAPPVVGFFEFSMMRRRSDIDQRAVAEAYEDYENAEINLSKTLFAGDTSIGRTLVHEAAVAPDDLAELLTYERARDVVGEAGAWGVSLCYCRHLAQHLGRACEAPMDNCLSLGFGAEMLVRHGNARAIDRVEALEILDRSRQAGLVFIGDNVQRKLTYICSCCACCCAQLRAINKLGLEGAVKTSPMVATIDASRCTGCGRCARACPVQAIQIRPLPPHVQRKARMYSTVDAEACLGCGVCQPRCRKDALTMTFRGQRTLTPEGSMERLLTMALERGKLQHLLFDDQQGLHMLALNRLTGAILRLPPVKRTLLRDALKSRFIGFLASKPAV